MLYWSHEAQTLHLSLHSAPPCQQHSLGFFFSFFLRLEKIKVDYLALLYFSNAGIVAAASFDFTKCWYWRCTMTVLQRWLGSKWWRPPLNNPPPVKGLNTSLMRIKDLGERKSTQAQHKHNADWFSFLHIIYADGIIKKISVHFLCECKDSSS